MEARQGACPAMPWSMKEKPKRMVRTIPARMHTAAYFLMENVFIPYEIGHGQMSDYLLQLLLFTNVDFVVLNIFCVRDFVRDSYPFQ